MTRRCPPAAAAVVEEGVRRQRPVQGGRAVAVHAQQHRPERPRVEREGCQALLWARGRRRQGQRGEAGGLGRRGRAAAAGVRVAPLFPLRVAARRVGIPLLLLAPAALLPLPLLLLFLALPSRFRPRRRQQGRRRGPRLLHRPLRRRRRRARSRRRRRRGQRRLLLLLLGPGLRRLRLLPPRHQPADPAPQEVLQRRGLRLVAPREGGLEGGEGRHQVRGGRGLAPLL